MSFLKLEDKKVLIIGVANKKSVAYFIAKTLTEENAKIILSVRDESTKQQVMKYLPNAEYHICDVEKDEDIKRMAKDIKKKHGKIDSLIHSIAFANYSEGFKPFHETNKNDFLQAVNISCFSLINISNAFKDIINENGSVVTISISTTKMAAENYGYMAPIKAALDSSVVFLAKSFSAFSNVRFNAVGAGLLKTSSSAGIPNYVNSYLYAEKATLRNKNLKTQEVADLAVYLISERSSGINAQTVVIDAGMYSNFFNKEIVEKVNQMSI